MSAWSRSYFWAGHATRAFLPRSRSGQRSGTSFSINSSRRSNASLNNSEKSVERELRRQHSKFGSENGEHKIGILESSDAISIESYSGTQKIDSKKQGKRERRRLGLQRLRANLEASKSSSVSSHVSGQQAIQCVINTEDKQQRQQEQQQARVQKAVRDHSIAFARRCLGLPVKDSLLRIESQRIKIPQDVIFFCIDTEGGKEKTTELGIAVLDTRSIVGVNPGSKACKWFQHTRTRRFTTLPYGHRFDFGITEQVPLAALKPYLHSLLNPMRKYVLVGHSGCIDFEKLSRLLNYDLRLLPNIVGLLDTFEIVRGLPIPQKLGGLWKHLHGVGQRWNVENSSFAFHNAGNDAVCTLQALLLLATSPESEWVHPKPGEPLVRQFPRFYGT